MAPARARLAGATGVAASDPIAPPRHRYSRGDDATWPAGALLAGAGKLSPSTTLARRFRWIPTGAWDRAPREAVVAPIAQSGAQAPAGLFSSPRSIRIAGLGNPSYRGFVDLVCRARIASGLANADAYEEARAARPRL